MHRRLVMASVIAVVTAAFLPGSGFGSSAAAARAAHAIPAGLAAAIHARFGAAGAIGSSSAPHGQRGPAHFGFSVALSADGTTALVGAPHVHGGGGAAYVFHVSDGGSWSSSDTPTAALTHTDPSESHQFGFDVALSADGTTAFVGAPGPFDQPDGAIYVFHVAAEDAWASSSAPTATLTGATVPLLGYVLAVSPDGTTIVAGDPDTNGSAGGAVVFHVSGEGAWATTSTPTASLSNAGESGNDQAVGISVAISGDGTTALVSDALSPTGGGAYVYHVAAENAGTVELDADSDPLRRQQRLARRSRCRPRVLRRRNGRLPRGSYAWRPAGRLRGRLPRFRGSCLGLHLDADGDVGQGRRPGR